LRQWFEPVTAAFMLDGDGPRFMQDHYLKLADKKQRDDDSGGVENIQQLLIDCAGEGEKAKDNTDLFVKRKSAGYGLCECCCAAALYTLQANAPGGGRGYLVSIRGGGPLTTLIRSNGDQELWKDLWLNVVDRGLFDTKRDPSLEPDPQLTFPWLASLRKLQPGGIATLSFEGPKGGPKPADAEKPRLQPSQVTPAHVFWGMPRRIKLNFESTTAGACDVCGRHSTQLVTKYLTKNYGLNYKGAWNHPLSPYYETNEGWLPLHPQPDGLGYRHWLSWVLGAASDRQTTRVADVVTRAMSLPNRTTGGPLRLWAFGYDMDNMKARCWYESTLPVYGLGDCSNDARSGVKAEVGRWLAAAELAGSYLRGAVKDAWFSADARGEFGHIDASYWSATEADFYKHLQALIESVAANADHPALPARVSWHGVLTRTALRLFDDNFVGTGAVERQNPRRVALAHRQLRSSLYGPKLRLALGLPVDTTASQPARKSTKRATKEAA